MPTFLHWLCFSGTVCLFLLSGTAQAQAQPLDAFSTEDPSALLSQQARRAATQNILAASSGTPLEGALDPDTYIIGPGDVFSISIGGALPVQLTPVVTADGALVLPEVGSLDVAGATLAEVRERAQARLRGVYRNVPTEVALAQPRQFYVHVSGEVTQPGRHVAIPVARVEDALATAMGGNPLLVFRQHRQARTPLLPALRNIEVRRQNGERIVVDLLRYYATGDTRYNPYLTDGDALYVPAFQRDVRAVYVDRGGLADLPARSLDGLGTPASDSRQPELFDYRPDDTVSALLLVAGGPALLEKAQTIRIVRTHPDGRLEPLSVDVPAILRGTSEDPALHPLDRLHLFHQRQNTGSVTAEGFVVHPGSYPIIEGETTLRDLLEVAGGIAAEGLLRGAYLERGGSPPPTELPPTTPSATTILEQREDAIAQRVFENTRLSDLSFGSRQYLTREILGFQRVSLDLSNGIDALPSIPLRDGDRLVVPRDPKAVLVVGQVRYPGYVTLKPGADARYYLEQAGGTGPAATEVYLREAGTGTFHSSIETPIRSGDVLFVDRPQTADTEELQALALQERQVVLQEENITSSRRIQYFQIGLTILSTAITTYLLFNPRTGN